VVYATDAVRRGLSERNVLYRTLQRFEGQVTWRELELGREVELSASDGRSSGISLIPVPVPGKQPVHLEGIAASGPQENIGLRIRGCGRTLAYASSAGAVDAAVAGMLEDADCVFFDGTFWSETEIVDLGLGSKRARDMAHLPIGGETGSLERLARLRAPRRFFIHVNNTNPILREDSAEAAAIAAAGWKVAEDGMELEL
jgi:pyrroloquinoline quinone biosynthesis protein B